MELMESAVIALCVCTAFILGFLASRGINTTQKIKPLESPHREPQKQPPKKPNKQELIRRCQMNNFFNYNGGDMPDPEEQADKLIYGVSRESD